ncbi:unnamed protein product [Lymnaea stagnalis]|uniref:Uncharacterized protein n=1 Tax=Lymnaea stagnalis TaxID=6523 RepID=A0AAV2HIB8_LYMST
MPLNRKWRSMDFFGSKENLHKAVPAPGVKDEQQENHHNKGDHNSKGEPYRPYFSLKNRLSSIGSRDESSSGPGRNVEPQDPSGGGLVQRCVIIQRDEKGYGFTVSGDNPVFVASVKADGAASKAGVQQGDRIVKVNGTLVTSRNHLDVVKLIKSGSYVALTLLGKPNLSSIASPNSTISTNRVSVNAGRVTAPQPVDPDKDKELWQQKVVMTRTMFETAKEDFDKLQKLYVSKPSEKLHAQLLEKERTVKTLDNQLKQLTGGGDETSGVRSPSLVPVSHRISDSEHGGLDHTWQMPGPPPNIKHTKQSSVPSLVYKTPDGGPADMRYAPVARSKSDAQTRKSKAASTFYVGFHGANDSEASSLPTTTSDFGSMSDSPQTSPSVSPTPNDPHGRHNGQEMEESTTSSTDIITIDDEDAHSDDDQLLSVPPWTGGRPTSLEIKITAPELNDPGPFADIKLLESKPAHMAIFLNYLISNSDPSPVLFHVIVDTYSRTPASTKELKKWAYEIYSTFVAQSAPLSIAVDDSLISQLDNILTVSAKSDNETVLKNMFQPTRQWVQAEIAELLADFRNKKDLGMLNFYGGQKLQDDMDRQAEVRAAEELLIPLLESMGSVSLDENNPRTERDQATVWALATFLRLWVGTKSVHNAVLDRVQTFLMKDKRSIKFPGSRSSRAKDVKGHQFVPQHFSATTNCNFCGHLIWGVGCQGFQCQTCKMPLHKQCVDEITEVCGGKNKKRGAVPIKFINSMPSKRTSSIISQTGPHQPTEIRQGSDVPFAATQPYREDNQDLAGIPGSGHSVKNIAKRYELSPTETGPVQGAAVTTKTEIENERLNLTFASHRRVSTDLSRSGSLNNKGEKQDRPTRRAKSDVDVNPDAFKQITQSGSSSTSSLSTRSIDSPSNSTDTINDLPSRLQYDSDLDVDTELPSLKNVLGEDILKKLKPKEKKRQEVINELFYTERTHLRNLKIIDILFNKPMLEMAAPTADLARALFPAMGELINLHASITLDMKERVLQNPVVANVGDLLLKRFDGQAGEWFRKICAEYCRNQAFALDYLKKMTRKEPKLQQFLNDAESNTLCRRLQLKDLVPSQMQRLTKYPLLIDNLLKYTQAGSDEYKHLERAHERCKHILAYVNTAVKECENYHKLKDIQKRLDRKSLETLNDPHLADLKTLELTSHKLIFDGPLIWKLRSHRTVDLHVLLFDDMLVLLQKQDDRYILKCQSTNVQAARDEHKYTHSPVLRLQNLLARNLATDKKSFFVVNISEVRAQMYEFTAQTSDLRVKWCKLINDKADELKKSGNFPGPRTSTLIQAPQLEQVEIERNRLSSKDADSSSPVQEISTEQDHVDSLHHLEDMDTHHDEKDELIQPNEVIVSNPDTYIPEAVHSPLELLRENTQQINTSLQERERLVAQVLNLSWNQYRSLNQKSSDLSARGRQEEEEESSGGDVQYLLARAYEINAQYIQLVSSSIPSVAPQQQHHHMDEESPSSPSRPLSTLSQGESSASEAESSSSGVSSQQPTILPPPQIVQSTSLNIPVPMEQLKEMATEMNTILSKLMSAMSSGSEEKHRLRKELQEAQLKLDALKEMQRQMSGAPSSGRISPYSPLSPAFASLDIPTESTGARNELQGESMTRTVVQTSQSYQATAEITTTDSDEGANFSSMCDIVHHGIQQVTQLEESVEALTLSNEPAQIIQATATESRTGGDPGQDKIEYNMGEDDDDGSNEVSVADLPLPDSISIPEAEHDPPQHLDTQDPEDSETESDDNDITLTSKTTNLDFPSLSTTIEDSVGEEREGELRPGVNDPADRSSGSAVDPCQEM